MTTLNGKDEKVNGLWLSNQELERLTSCIQFQLGLLSRTRREITALEDTVRDLNSTVDQMRTVLRQYRQRPQRQQVI